jgi:hypothetical protein
VLPPKPFLLGNKKDRHQKVEDRIEAKNVVMVTKEGGEVIQGIEMVKVEEVVMVDVMSVIT